MLPTDWSKAWGCPIIQGRSDEHRLPAASRKFLATIGLPQVVIFEFRNSFEISFLPLKQRLAAYNNYFSWGDFHDEIKDRTWDHQIVVAVEEFCNGQASYCISEEDETVSRIDCELEQDPQSFVNSQIERFGLSLMAATRWSNAVHAQATYPAPDSFVALADELKQIDPPAFQDQNHFWPSLIQFILDGFDSDDHDLVITCDPTRSKSRF